MSKKTGDLFDKRAFKYTIHSIILLFLPFNSSSVHGEWFSWKGWEAWNGKPFITCLIIQGGGGAMGAINRVDIILNTNSYGAKTLITPYNVNS